jgi:hypothetical protein
VGQQSFGRKRDTTKHLWMKRARLGEDGIPLARRLPYYTGKKEDHEENHGLHGLHR